MIFISENKIDITEYVEKVIDRSDWTNEKWYSKLGISLLHMWEMKIVKYTLLSCYGGILGTEISTLQYMAIIVLHNGNILINTYRGCVYYASPTKYKEPNEVIVVLPLFMDK
uniref:Uncharacterized protein n=1 Tax=Lactuca sativa TaxID=4236 RepID=A0A9R1UD53_LACSA|nr:hypothetical protein LSAT_V11C900473990 [Lactuca sativa]